MLVMTPRILWTNLSFLCSSTGEGQGRLSLCEGGGHDSRCGANKEVVARQGWRYEVREVATMEVQLCAYGSSVAVQGVKCTRCIEAVDGVSTNYR